MTSFLLSHIGARDVLAALLAQVPGHAPVIIAQDTAISWPVLVTFIAVCAVIIESRVKIHRLEQDAADARKDLVEARKETSELRAQQNKTEVVVGGMAAVLGEIKAGVTEMRKELREDLRARSHAA